LSGIRVANAPCSYGAFEITVGILPDVPGPERVLTAISSAGYEGSELGPPGYLGDRDNLRDRLEEHGLALVGGYIPIRFTEPEHWEEDLAAMDGTLDLFAAGDGTEAKAVLADGGSPERAPTVVSISRCPPAKVRLRKIRKIVSFINCISGPGSLGNAPPRVPLRGTSTLTYGSIHAC